MSLVLAKNGPDLQIIYVFNGLENVGSTQTMVSGTQVSQNVGFTRFSTCKNLVMFDFSLGRPERPPGHKKSTLSDKKTTPLSNLTFSGQAEILRNTTLLNKKLMKY